MLLATLSCGGCSAPAPLADYAPRPGDFAVDLTILSGDAAQDERRVHLRTSRYVVRADGALHAAVGRDLTAADLPPFTRQLRIDHLNVLWEIAHDGGLTNPAEADPVGNIELVRGQSGQVTYVAAITAAESRITIGRTWTFSEPAAPRLERLARTLAAFAWEGDEPDRGLRRIPRRYDFGPDPYARYRPENRAPPAEID